MSSINDLKAQGGFGGMHVASEFTPNGNLLWLGGGGAWVINSNIYIGGAGYGGLNTLSINDNTLNSIGYGGLMLGYFTEVRNSIRIGSDLLVGSGGYELDNLEEEFFLLEPNVKCWYSINSYTHGSIGLYYRIAFLNADAALDTKDLSNFGIKLNLNFGKL